MTRIEAIKRRLAAATPWPIDVFEQDLRDLLLLYDVAADIRHEFNGRVRMHDQSGYPDPAGKAFEKLRAVLSTLDAPVGDEE